MKTRLLLVFFTLLVAAILESVAYAYHSDRGLGIIHMIALWLGGVLSTFIYALVKD